MAEKDIVSKQILKHIALDMARYLFELDIQEAELLDNEYQRIEDRRADLVLHVKAPDAFLLHIEVQNNHHPHMVWRMLRYRLDMRHEYPDLPIRQYLVYIGQKPLRMTDRIDEPNLSYAYTQIDTRQLDCQHLLECDNPDALVLAILCDFHGQDPSIVIRTIIQRLQTLLQDDSTGFREYFAMLEILSENRNLQTLVNEEFAMLSSTKLSSLPSYQKGRQSGIQEGRQEGRQEGQQEGEHLGEHKGLARSLRYLLEQKFGNLPGVIEQQMQNADDEQLLHWMGCVLQANDLSDVFSRLR